VQQVPCVGVISGSTLAVSLGMDIVGLFATKLVVILGEGTTRMTELEAVDDVDVTL
jgi:hypothetical protein